MTDIIRAGRVEDIPGILTLWTEAEVEPGNTDDAVSLARLLNRDPEAIIVAESDGGIVGSIIAAWDGWRGTVYRLAVAPPHRRRGLGGRLLEEAEHRLSALGAVRLQAIVVESDLRAVGFWRASVWDEQIERLRFTRG